MFPSQRPVSDLLDTQGTREENQKEKEKEMKIIRIIIDIALAILPYWASKKKKNLEQELEIANKTINLLTKDKTPAEKAVIISDGLRELECVKKFTKRVGNKFEKAKQRLYKKIL